MKSLSFRHKGFTLIELVIVLVLLAILGLIASAKYSDYRVDTKIASLREVAAAMTSAIEIVHTKAVLAGTDQGESQITLNGVNVLLFEGYPTIDSTVSFPDLNKQVQAWLDIDSVDRDTASKNRNAAPLFIDKRSSLKEINIFFSHDYDQKSATFGCQVQYRNSAPPTITVLTDEC
ncbi:type IV pilin [Vibrio breoganii]|uniref:Type IV pilin n=1 Tax=Vibrio breoganii TaxID=553239 RepID=A0AAN0XX68_9VIBR|nr:prepilin-type N-terminal cleavage/methylation domain-containing protein [Vibrio breoganii]ANO34271.1 type IV pilin [Vibrio breoganii]PMG80550.1 type IV pilin [Vibrio breoganii]PMO35375.1 type IV pilin [Vibrio breoganii]